MKKFAVMLLGLIFASSLFAFDFSLGVRGNLNFSSLTGEPQGIDNKHALAGGGLAAVVVLGPVENFAIQVEAGYNCQNGVYYEAGGQKNSVSFSTFDIPLLLKGRVRLGPGLLGIGTGPQISIIVGDVKLRSGDQIERESADTLDFTNPLFGLVSVVDYSLRAGFGTFVFGVRVEIDFTGLENSPFGGSFGNRMRISPGIGYLLTI